MTDKKFDDAGNDLRHYMTPEWFQDAKLGIFIHWGIYSVPAYGDEWYGHWMYKPGTKSWAGDDIYSYNQQHHPGIGYKDFIPSFKGEHFNAAEWAELFMKAGAKYVVPVAMHHDSFALYDSGLTKWKSTAMGPRRDIIAELSSAVRNMDMNFGISNHFAENWWFFPHESGYDTADPACAELYNKENRLTEEHVQRWYRLSLEQIEKFQPDLLYFDFEIEKPEFKTARRALAAHYYNKQQEWNKGVVLNYKYGAFEEGEAVLDVERGQLSGIRSMSWQACTSISNKSWGYIENDSFKTAEQLINTLVDIVSKNGCLLLNVGPKADGTIPQEQQDVLIKLGEWLRVNGEAIYAARPWTTHGEGPTEVGGKALSEKDNGSFTAEDIRFTTSKDNKNLYAIVLAAPNANQMTIKALNSETYDPSSIKEVSILGGGSLAWKQDRTGLVIDLPSGHRISGAYAVKISLN